VRQGPRHRVSVAEAADGTRVVLKQLRAEQASGSARFRLRREHGLLLGIESRFVPRPIELLADAPEPTLVLPWHGGVPLAELSATPLAPSEILDTIDRKYADGVTAFIIAGAEFSDVTIACRICRSCPASHDGAAYAGTSTSSTSTGPW